MRNRIAIASAILLSACAPKDDPPDTAAGESAAPKVVQVHAIDYAFHGPDSVAPGWTTFRLVNGGATLHHLAIARLDSGKTVADVNAAMSPHAALTPPWLVWVGGPNAPDPQQEANATVNLTPGSYAMICIVDIPGGVPHVARGMVHGFTVPAPAKQAASTAPPAADIDIKLVDYAFVLSKDITAGRHTFAVTTDAAQPHEVELLRLADGKTEKDFMAWMQKMDGPPPMSAVGGVAPIVAGQTAYFDAEFTPGTYILICFLPDVHDPAKLHLMKGMMQTIKVN